LDFLLGYLLGMDLVKKLEDGKVYGWDCQLAMVWETLSVRHLMIDLVA
jgi:hypothetical protein